MGRFASQLTEGEPVANGAEPRPAAPSPGFSPNLMMIVWRRQTTVALVVLICLSAAGAFLLRATPLYTSTSRIYVEQNTPKFLNEGELDQIASERADSYLYTQAEVIGSIPILTAALDVPGVAQAKVLQKVDNQLVYLKRALSVDVGKKDDIITVAFSAPDPEESSSIVNAVVNAYVTYESKMQKGTTGEILKVLAEEKDKHDAELQQEQSDLLVFKQSNGSVFFKTADKGTIVMQDLATVSDEMTKAKLMVAQAHAEYSAGNSKTAASSLCLIAQARLQNFQQVYNDLEQQALSLNAKTAEFEKMEADIARTEKIIDLLDTRIKELDVTEDSGPLNISILEIARPEDKPSFPRRGLTLAAALLVGLMLGVGAALTHEWMDQRLRSAEEVNDLLGLTVLGVVPEVHKSRAALTNMQVELEPMSEVAEAFRSLRTAIYFGMPDRSTKTLLITSPAPGDGKSTTASNLSISLAQTGKRTLLIDADLRKPVQHQTFELSGEIGLSDVVGRGVPLETALQRTKIEGLDLLPCGSIPPNPAEILNSPRFSELLATLSKRYDQIVLDSPPVLPVTDARILGAICDVTVLVLRAEKSTRKGSEHACERMLNVGTRLIGAVVNGVSRRKNSYGYYEHYYQYAYYSRDPEIAQNGIPALKNGNGHALVAKENGADGWRDSH
jgi:capsular exopolysaccharide synthesis family protein